MDCEKNHTIRPKSRAGGGNGAWGHVEPASLRAEEGWLGQVLVSGMTRQDGTRRPIARRWGILRLARIVYRRAWRESIGMATEQGTCPSHLAPYLITMNCFAI